MDRNTLIGTTMAAEITGLTSRTIRFWVEAGLLKASRETRASEHRRPCIQVRLGDVTDLAEKQGKKFPAGWWSDLKARQPGNQEPVDPRVTDPGVADLDSYFDAPQVEDPDPLGLVPEVSVRDEAIDAAVQDHLSQMADEILEVVADSETWGEPIFVGIPCLALKVREALAKVKAAGAYMVPRVICPQDDLSEQDLDLLLTRLANGAKGLKEDVRTLKSAVADLVKLGS